MNAVEVARAASEARRAALGRAIEFHIETVELDPGDRSEDRPLIGDPAE